MTERAFWKIAEGLKQAAEMVKAMSDEELAVMHARQAQSFVRSCVDNPPDHTDDPLAHLIAANERLHAEVQRLTDEHALLMQSIEQALSDPENQPSQFGTVPVEWWQSINDEVNRKIDECVALRSENLTLRADLATSEQTIAALKAQLQRVKEAAE